MYVRVWRLAWPGLTYNLKSSRFIVFTFAPQMSMDGHTVGRRAVAAVIVIVVVLVVSIVCM